MVPIYAAPPRLHLRNCYVKPSNMRFFLIVLLWLGVQPAHAQSSDLNYLFKPGDHGYKCFRIPAVIKTSKGSLLAFAEARKNHCGDADDIDLVLRRSEDGGQTWSPMIIVWDDGGNTCGNPAPVVDARNGRIVLLSTWNLGGDHEPQIINLKSKDTRRIFVMHSDDDGLQWSTPREITTDVKQPD